MRSSFSAASSASISSRRGPADLSRRSPASVSATRRVVRVSSRRPSRDSKAQRGGHRGGGVGLPGALKTATPGIMHKGDVGGVKRTVATADTVSAANDDPASPLGQRVLVVTMIR